MITQPNGHSLAGLEFADVGLSSQALWPEVPTEVLAAGLRNRKFSHFLIQHRLEKHD